MQGQPSPFINGFIGFIEIRAPFGMTDNHMADTDVNEHGR